MTASLVRMEPASIERVQASMNDRLRETDARLHVEQTVYGFCVTPLMVRLWELCLALSAHEHCADLAD